MWTILSLIGTFEYCGAQGIYGKMTCANCSGVNAECQITSTGWSCDHDFDAKKLIEKGDASDIPESLRKCMLTGMAFKKKEALYGYCCIWSPKIGCQKLKRSDGIEDLCYKCTRSTWSSVMNETICPCGDWFMHRGNSGMMPKPWNFHFITQGMLIIIVNL
ncbi:hypothetical protein KR054_003445 [Drosophila jambulina]|nr:hypothetical protein KR054_003445 [Drosophila jambulina]